MVGPWTHATYCIRKCAGHRTVRRCPYPRQAWVCGASEGGTHTPNWPFPEEHHPPCTTTPHTAPAVTSLGQGLQMCPGFLHMCPVGQPCDSQCSASMPERQPAPGASHNALPQPPEQPCCQHCCRGHPQSRTQGLAQRGQVTCPRSHSQVSARPWLQAHGL